MARMNALTKETNAFQASETRIAKAGGHYKETKALRAMSRCEAWSRWAIERDGISLLDDARFVLVNGSRAEFSVTVPATQEKSGRSSWRLIPERRDIVATMAVPYYCIPVVNADDWHADHQAMEDRLELQVAA